MGTGRRHPGPSRTIRHPAWTGLDEDPGPRGRVSRLCVLEEIHRGGQGVVYKALQESTQRHVAIKVLQGGHVVSSADRARFAQEIQVLGQLRHAHIVRIFDSGAAGGLFYYVMDYIPGRPLDTYVRHATTSFESVYDFVRLFLKICDAVNAAHLRGIIHRDLKPGNIRVDGDGEPHVLDFGLSKLTASEQSDVTATGQFVGSIPWAAPEQAEGRVDAIDLRTDVYSLGVLFYQMLTGQLPYDARGSVSELLLRITRSEPTPPRTHVPSLSPDLETIVLKCLHKNPERRYQSAGDLARDLRRFLAREPIEAKRDSAWYVLRKRLVRYRAAAMIASLALLLALASLGGIAGFYAEEHRLRAVSDAARVESDRLRAAAEQARRAAEAAKDEAVRREQVAEALNEFFTTQIVIQATPERMGRDVPLREVLAAASEGVDAHVPDDPRLAAEIHFMLSVAFREVGDPVRTARHARRAHEIAERAFTAEHEFTQVCANNDGQALLEIGELAEAAAVFERLVATRARLLGPEHPDTSESRVNLGWTYFRLGRMDESVALLRETLEEQRKSPGPDDESTLTTMHNLATVLTDLRRFAEAAPLREAYVAAMERIHGPDHTDTLRAVGQLALLKEGLGQTEEAERLLRDTLDRQRERLGHANPSAITTLNNLASLLARNGRNADAVTLLTEGIAAAEPTLGAANPTLVTMESNLGELYRREGRHAEALALHQEVLARAAEYLPESHRYLGLYNVRLGKSLVALERFDEAERHLLRGHEIYAAAEGVSENERRDAAAAIEALYESWKRPEKLAAWRAATSRPAGRP